MLNVRFESLHVDKGPVGPVEDIWPMFDPVAPRPEQIAESIKEFRAEYSQRIGNRQFSYIGKLELAKSPEDGGVEQLLVSLGVSSTNYAGMFKYGQGLVAAMYSVPRWPGYYVFVRGVQWGLMPPTRSVAVFVFRDETKAAEPKP